VRYDLCGSYHIAYSKTIYHEQIYDKWLLSNIKICLNFLSRRGTDGEYIIYNEVTKGKLSIVIIMYHRETGKYYVYEYMNEYQGGLIRYGINMLLET